MMKDFKAKVAVITGAGSGLGRSLAVKLNQAGAHLALCDLNPQGLDQTRAQLSPAGTVSLHQVDVTSLDQITRLEQEVQEVHGAVDILINNAGITLTPTRFEAIPDDQFRQVLDVNMWGVYNGIRVFLPHLQERPEAAIVNISSLAGLVGLYGYAPYVMSKFAVRGLSETLQTELVGSSISLLIVHPGGIKTDLIRNAPDLPDDQSRESAHQAFTRAALLTPDQAAEKILRAVQKKKRRLILGADAKIVNAIRSLFPGRFPDILNTVFSQSPFQK